MSFLDEGQLRAELGWGELLEEDYLAILQGREQGESGVNIMAQRRVGWMVPMGRGG